MELPDPYIEFLENWIPGIGEPTILHDELHRHFNLGFSINDEARLLGFQLGHHPASNVFHVGIYLAMSSTIFPHKYRNGIDDLKDFYSAYMLGKRWQSVSYWYVPRDILSKL